MTASACAKELRKPAGSLMHRAARAAWRMSGSDDLRARRSMSPARGLDRPGTASARSAARTIGVRGASFGLPSMLLPPSTSCSRASSATRLARLAERAHGVDAQFLGHVADSSPAVRPASANREAGSLS